MDKLINSWRALSKQKKTKIFIALFMTVLFTMQVTVFAWFKNQREAARLERINSPNLLFITAAHREDSINLVMDDITVDGKWSDDTSMQYQDYVFSVAGEYVDTFTLQLTHTTNNPYTYEIFEASVTKNEPTANEVKGKHYVTYTATNDYPADLVSMPDNDSLEVEEGDLLYYRRRTISENNVNKPVSLNRTNDLTEGETNTYSYTDGSLTKTVTFDGHYLNMGNDGLATEIYNNDYTYKTYTYKDPHVQPLYWQCTNIPGSSGTSKNAFYHEYILRVYFNGASASYKDTDIVYITALGNG